jgi:DNA-binding LacI/PurR family transcriptional regulator
MHRPGVILPPTKELTGRYGACYRTLRKALHGLIGEGLLEVHGAGFRVPVLSARHSQATVVLIAGGDEIGNLLAHRPRVRENLGALEQECARSRVRLRIAPFSDRFRSPSGAELGGGSVVGYLLWSTSIPPSEVASMLRRFCAEGKPVALLDEREGVLVDAGHPGAGLVQSFTMGISPLCGRHVARHLLELGHRRVAYLSPFAQLTAGQDRRLQGLTETFAAAGLPNAVAPFTATERGSPVAVTTLPDDVSRSMEGLLRITARQTARHPAANARSSHTLRRAMVGIMHEQTFWKALAPMCRRALEENPEATAWIGYNDMTALECIDYLRSRRRRLPQDISVVGFDNTAEASYEGLTSYDFNSAAVMHEMLAHVLAPGRIRARRSPGQAVEIEGFVAERASTGPARTVAAATKSATARVSSPVG